MARAVLNVLLVVAFFVSAFSKRTTAFRRDKTRFNLIILGHEGHGKTTLASAITKVQGEKGLAKYKTSEELNKPQEEKFSGITIKTTHVEFETDKRIYTLVDCPGHTDYVKYLITQGAELDGAILVVSALDGVMPQTKQHVRLANQVGVPNIVVYISKADEMDDQELSKLVDAEVRELLSKFHYDIDTPIVAGSALKALEGKKPEIGVNSIKNLLAALDSHIPTPTRAIDKPFLMPVEDVFSVIGRGTVATGRIERGVVKVGETVALVGIRNTIRTTVTGVEMFRKLLDRGEAGDNVGLLLRGVKRDQVERGMVACKPGSIKSHTRFEGLVYILTRKEGGRHTPFFNNYRPQFYFRTTDVTGAITLPEDIMMVMPGDKISFTVELIAPIALEVGTRFAIREGGRTIGAGVVTKIFT